MTVVEEEVAFANGEITLAAMLTLPDRSAAHPSVVLLQGSGPLNRNEEAFGLKPFAMIADSLARNGIASLRYDSRGVGGSSGAHLQYTLSDVARDVLAAVQFLKARRDIDSAAIGLCGHSQGAIVAPMCAAASEDIAFMICIGGMGSTGEENLLAQTRLIADVDGATKEDVEDRIQSMKHIINLVRDGADQRELELEFMRMVQAPISTESEPREAKRNVHNSEVDSDPDHESDGTADNNTGGNPDDGLAAEVSCHLAMFNSPWFRSFIDHDAVPVLESVNCPTLLIFGELDLQVPPDLNREPMVAALEIGGNADYVGSPSEYGTLGQEFVPGFLDLISDWIRERVTRP